MFSNVYSKRNVLVTGHTGFKGSWLTMWLEELGAKIVGLALPPHTSPNHCELLGLSIDAFHCDIRDQRAVTEYIASTAPEIIFHLAAQPLVRRSYRDPIETWSTNVLGTAHVLEACRQCPTVKAIVVVTTDKCYENREQVWGYREVERLGGHDPYSASKAAAELVVASYRSAYFNGPDAPLLASARAGNVIGGGDWSEDRLIPDAARAVAARQSLEIRSPHATRPWQHVLESLSGYLMLGEQLLAGNRSFADAWNFGPGPEGNRTVLSVLQSMKSHWPELQWHETMQRHPHETTLLQLDSTKARRLLGWEPVWSVDEGIIQAADWYSAFYNCGRIISHEQLRGFIGDARQLRRSWALT